MQATTEPTGATPQPRAVTAKGLATRERLLAAAERVFGEQGYEQARVADIVAVAGVSHGLFYRHFRDKGEVLAAVLSRLNARLRQSSARPPGTGAVPTLADLQARHIEFFREYASQRALFRVSREAAARADDSGFRADWLRIRALFTQRTRRWLDGLVAAGTVAPTDTAPLADALGAMTEQLAYVHIGLADSDPDDAELERIGRVCGLVWYRAVFGA